MMDTSEFKQRFETYKKEGIKAVYDCGKILPKYDGGADDNPWIPKGTKVPTENSQEVRVSALPKTTTVSKLVQAIDDNLTEQERGLAYLRHLYNVDKPLSGTDPIGKMIVENVGGYKGALVVGKLVNAYSKFVPKTGTAKLIKDVFFYPDEILKARINGNYPLTFSERRKYLQKLTDGEDLMWKHSQEMQNLLASKWPQIFLKGDRFRQPKVIRGGDVVMKRFGMSDNASGHFVPSQFDRVYVRNRQLGSLLPNTENRNHVVAHEYNHLLRLYDDYIQEQPFTIPVDKYFGLNPDFLLSFLFDKVVKPIGASGTPRSAWRISPDEFLSDYHAARAVGDKSGKLLPTFIDMSSDQQHKIVEYLSNRFDLPTEDVNTSLHFMSSIGGYDKGKSIHINPANKGKFNATKKRTGKTTEQLAHSKNPLTRKRAIFALNSRKFKH